MKKLKLLNGALIFLLAAGGACVAQSDQPSLGDLAKKTRQEKKVVKVFSNDDIATVKPDTSSQSAKVASSTPPATSEAAAKDQEKPKDKDTQKAAAVSKDSPQVAELKQKLTSYQQEQDGWKKSAKKYEDLLANETSDFRRQMYEEALQGDKENVEIFQNKIDQTQADLAKAEKSSSSSQ